MSSGVTLITFFSLPMMGHLTLNGDHFKWSFFTTNGGSLEMIFFLSSKVFNFSSYNFVGFQKIVWSFTRGDKGYLPFFLWTLKVFCFHIRSFRIFHFLLVVLGVFKFFVCEVSQVRKWGMRFLHVNFEFWIFYFLQFCSCHFGGLYFFHVKFLKGGDRVFDFLLETLKVFCFGLLKFRSFQFCSCHFGGL